MPNSIGCVPFSPPHPRNQGDGIPDGGLYTADQFQRQSTGEPKPGQLPSRGAIEVKGTKPDVMAVADSPQVAGYLETYGIVLVTNLRSFVIVDRGRNGRPTPREASHLAANEQEFWRQKAAHPRVAADERGPQFLEFVKTRLPARGAARQTQGPGLVRRGAPRNQKPDMRFPFTKLKTEGVWTPLSVARH